MSFRSQRRPPTPSRSGTDRHSPRVTTRVLAEIGLMGPILFVTGVVVAGAVTPGYSHLSEPISQLAGPGRPYWLIQVAGFVVFGISMIAIAFVLRRSLSDGFGAKVGIVLVGFAGLNLILTGLFRTDAMGQDSASIPGQIHETTSGLVFLSLIAAFLVLGRAMRRVQGWRDLTPLSIIAGVATLTFLVGFGLSFEVQPQYVGVWQRLLAMTIVVWFLVIAVRAKSLVPLLDAGYPERKYP